MTIDNGVRQRRQFSATTNVRNPADNKQRTPGDDDPYYKRDIHLEFKPLIEVDPTIKLSQNRAPLAIPRPGDYTLSKTASTEGIASKKSLELKKKYLLGESTAGTGVLKSGSASALDSKFKSFHSNITECQKLLNPAPEISPTMQTFLQKTASSPLVPASSLLSLRKDALLTGRNEEKENVYDGKIAPKRYVETVNATLVENKLNELKKEEAKDKKDDRPNNNNERLIETISLITPEKETRKVEEEQTVQKPIVEENGDRIVEIKNISNLKHMFIDLTSDSPNCDRSLVETTLNFSMTPPSAAKGTNGVQSNGELKNNIPDIISSIKIDNNENKVEEEQEQERTRSPAHETSIQVPEVPWDKEQEDEEDIDSDSISESSSSSSSTSSVDDIPHFILDSTTSPETQNDERFVPRVEVRDTAGELMQIDSLMIIDGKYIGDPEDLKLLEELPPDTKIAAKISQQEMNLDSICVLQSYDEKVLEEQLPTPTEEQKSPSIPLPVVELEPKEEPVEQPPVSKPSSPTQPKPDLKFDTRNENKLDTLKNLPLVLDLQPQKPRNLTFAANRKSPETDAEKTPLAPSQLLPQLAKAEGSDSDTELTAQNLTETELSDWAADDAVSENFVDIEFALCSNKGTIKRNKPKHGRLQQKKVIAASPLVPTVPAMEVRHQASEDGIMKNLAIEDIEFMDTGSEEESCIESYSTTNRTMLKNRGYVEFVDPKSVKPAMFAIGGGNNYGQQQQHQHQLPIKPMLVEAINKQVAGVDYIEQGAYLLNSAATDDSKTPMNEEPPTKITFSALAAQNKALQQQPPLQQQFDSLNDIEEDSLLIVTSSQGTGETTTEESEAPTIVAPVERNGGSGSSGRGSVSSFSSKQLEGDKSVGGSPIRKVSTESSSGGKRSSLERNFRKDSLKNNIDDIGYDEYVKRLQQKIALISSARDSLDVKKSKRKSSKGDAGLDDVPVVEPVVKPATASIYTEQSSLEVPKSVEKKIEEITKERVKQKDIIHDLVMDKLQTKKQLNAEKRLNRSRNRNNVLPGMSPGTPSQPTIAHSPESFTSYQPVATDRRNRILESKETTFAQPTPLPIFPNKENIATFTTPASYLQATPRTTVKKPAEETLTLTEQLREEARARARLKSNQDLGLSPEDRVQLLRKKFHINLRELNDQQQDQPANNKCDDTKFKERTTKLMTSKSVNDVSILKNLSNDPDFASPVDDGSPAAALIGAKLQDYVSDPNLVQSPTTGSSGAASDEIRLRTRSKCKDRERRKSIIEKVSEFFNSRKKTDAGGGSSASKDSSPTKKEGGGSGNELAAVPNSGSSSTSGGGGGVGFLRFKISPKLKDKSKSCFDMRNMGFGTKEGSPYERCASEDCLKNAASSSQATTAAGTTTNTSGRDTSTTTSSPPGGSSSGNRFTPIGRKEAEELEPPPIPPLPLNYQRSDDESCTTNEPKNELKKLRAMSKASRQAELKRLRIAQEIQREQEEIEVKIKDLETRGVEIEKELRGESESLEKNIENLGANDEGLVKEWLELMRSITRLKVRDEELTIRQQELQLEHRHAQLKEELNMRLSCSKLDKNSSDVAAEGAILNEMLEIVAKRQALRPSLDAAAAAAAASVGGAPTTTTPTTPPARSKDASDI